MPQTQSEFLQSEASRLGLDKFQLAERMGYPPAPKGQCQTLAYLSGAKEICAIGLWRRYHKVGITIPPDLCKATLSVQVCRELGLPVQMKEYPSIAPDISTPCGIIYREGMKCYVKNSASDCTYAGSRLINGERRYAANYGLDCPCKPKPEIDRRQQTGEKP